MTLEVENQKNIDNPSAEQIDEAISSLQLPSPSFAILSHSSMEYVQTAFGKGDGLLLEYQDGSVENHFQSIQTDLSQKKVAEVFCAFNNCDSSWKHSVEWRQLELKSKAGPLKRFSMVCFILFLLFSIPLFVGLDDDKRVKFLDLNLLTYFTLWSYLMLLSSLSDLRNFKNVDGRAKVYAITSVVFVVILTAVKIMSMLIVHV